MSIIKNKDDSPLKDMTHEEIVACREEAARISMSVIDKEKLAVYAKKHLGAFGRTKKFPIFVKACNRGRVVEVHWQNKKGEAYVKKLTNMPPFLVGHKTKPREEHYFPLCVDQKQSKVFDDYKTVNPESKIKRTRQLCDVRAKFSVRPLDPNAYSGSPAEGPLQAYKEIWEAFAKTPSYVAQDALDLTEEERLKYVKDSQDIKSQNPSPFRNGIFKKGMPIVQKSKENAKKFVKGHCEETRTFRKNCVEHPELCHFMAFLDPDQLMLRWKSPPSSKDAAETKDSRLEKVEFEPIKDEDVDYGESDKGAFTGENTRTSFVFGTVSVANPHHEDETIRVLLELDNYQPADDLTMIIITPTIELQASDVKESGQTQKVPRVDATFKTHLPSYKFALPSVKDDGLVPAELKGYSKLASGAFRVLGRGPFRASTTTDDHAIGDDESDDDEWVSAPKKTEESAQDESSQMELDEGDKGKDNETIEKNSDGTKIEEEPSTEDGKVEEKSSGKGEDQGANAGDADADENNHPTGIDMDVDEEEEGKPTLDVDVMEAKDESDDEMQTAPRSPEKKRKSGSVKKRKGKKSRTD